MKTPIHIKNKLGTLTSLVLLLLVISATWKIGIQSLIAGPIPGGSGSFTAQTETSTSALPARNFAQPDRIRYDGHCLTIDGQDTFIFSGAFHYFRCPKPLWHERFQKIKDAGFNTVETYVPWNWHEREQPAGLDDFSKIDLTDFKDWLKMAHDEFGLYTIIRPGPYICAEWDGGGFPRWLLNFKPTAPKRTHMWLRTDDRVFLAWSKHWYDAVCPVIAAEQITRKPKGGHGVILFQIENEYDGARGEAEERVNHLRALYQDAKADDIDVPVFTCWTHEIRGSKDPLLSQVFDGANEYPSWNVTRVRSAVLDAKQAQPSAPGMVPELQGGWFSQVGGKPNTLTAAQINAVTLMAYAGGATITSYYMLYGGFNPEGWGGRTLTTTYDYNAPIREPGGVGDRYLAVKSIAAMLQKYGPELARADLASCSILNGGQGMSFDVRRNPDGHTFVFCFNSNRVASARGNAVLKPENGEPISVSYDLEPFGMKVLCLPENEWQPEAVASPDRPAAPAPVPINSVLVRAEAGAKGWRPVRPGDSLSSQGILDTRSVIYRTRVSLTEPQVARLKILNLVLLRDDHVVVRVNGRLAQALQKGRHISVDVTSRLRTGPNEIELLYENFGQDNGGKGMEDLPGLQIGGLSPTAQDDLTLPVTFDDGIQLNWDMAPQLGGVAGKWWQNQLSTSGWRLQGLSGSGTSPVETNALAAWFRLEFELPAANPHVWVPWGLDLKASGNGWIYLNGNKLGRYWEAGPQRKFFLPACWLNFGPNAKNNVTLCLRHTDHGPSLDTADVAPYAEFAERR